MRQIVFRQYLCQSFRVLFVYNMSRMLYHLPFRVWNGLRQNMRRFQIGTVLFSAENQSRALDSAQSAAEILTLHGVSQQEGILFIKRHIPENRFRQKSEENILKGKRRSWNFMRCSD